MKNNLLCSKCKTNPKYLKSCWCSVCINSGKRALRLEKKKLGLKTYGENRRKNCRKCNSPKEENYMNDSLCKSCRSETNRDKRIANRAKKGLPLWGFGRKPTCSSCGKIKEKGLENQSKCKSCKSYSVKLNRTSKKMDEGLKIKTFSLFKECSACKSPKQDINKQYCKECLDLRKISRQFVKTALRKGHLNKMPCEICGDLKVDAHHEDYFKPLDVRWLCRKHHLEYHNTSGINQFNF